MQSIISTKCITYTIIKLKLLGQNVVSQGPFYIEIPTFSTSRKIEMAPKNNNEIEKVNWAVFNRSEGSKDETSNREDA